jgi:hypothetical protein
VTSSHSGRFTQGDPADDYTLRVSDALAGGPASGMVTVTDSLPAGITPVEMAGPGWTWLSRLGSPGSRPRRWRACLAGLGAAGE